MDDDTSVHDFHTQRAYQRVQSQREEAIEQAISNGYEAIANRRPDLLRQHTATLTRLLFNDDTGTVWERDADLREFDGWDYDALQAVLGDAAADFRTLTRAHQSCVVAAAADDSVRATVRRKVPTYGHAVQLGRQPVSPDAHAPSARRIVDPDSHPPVAAFQGLPGYGKSTAVASAVEDRFRAGKKIVDVADLGHLENGLYDVPQQQPGLRDVRERMGLPADFREHPHYERPDVEILVPLTEDIDEQRIPVTEDGDTVVRPFAIPASALSRRALNLMLSHVTDVQQTYLDRAHEQVSNEREEWSLRDLADAVLSTDATDGVKRRLYNTLAHLQSVGFIRDGQSDHVLDWERVFRDTDTITVFTQSTLEDRAHQFMLASYLLYSLYHERGRLTGLPPLVTVFRELHDLAPNSATAAEDDRERDLQMGMVSAFQTLCSKHRHQDIEVLCDTQQIMGQVNKRARSQIERVVTFRAQMGTLRSLFEDVVGTDGSRESYMKRIVRDFEPGEAAILGKTGTGADLVMTVQWAPPMCHHLDATEGRTGWEARCDITQQADELPTESLEPAPWDGSLAERLTFEPLAISDEEQRGIVDRFADAALVEGQGSIRFDRVMAALEAFAEKEDVEAPPHQSASQKLKNRYEYESDRRRFDDGLATVCKGITLTSMGEQLLPEDEGVQRDSSGETPTAGD